MTNKFQIPNSKIFIILLLSTFYFLLSFGAFAQQPASTFQLPPGSPITYASLSAGLDLTAKFLYGAGVTLAVITLVVSGIMFFWAKSSTDAKEAKGWFKNGIIGAFIILAVGVIINTIKIIVQGKFF